MEKYVFPFEWVGTEGLVVCYGLTKMRSDAVQDDIDEVVVCLLGIDIESIDMVQVFLNSNCFFEIADFVKSLVWLAMVAIGFPNSILDLFLGSIPVLFSFPPFQRFLFYA